MLKPLWVMLCFNRVESSRRALESIRATTNIDNFDVHIVDNGSMDGTREWLMEQRDVVPHYFDQNVGVSRAFNWVLERYRSKGQHFIRMCDDMEILTPSWWLMCQQCLEEGIAIILGDVQGSPSFQRTKRRAITIAGYDGWIMSWPPTQLGIHAGWFMDKIGYFDVLAPEHLWGYEDIILLHKAHKLKRGNVVALKDLQVRCINAVPALGALPEQAMRVAMRPLYLQRRQALRRGGSIYTAPDGKPK